MQQYFDHDPTRGASDFRCGQRVYDGHDGTDIRIPTLAAARRGVDVVAAAVGVVQAVRDGVADGLLAGPDVAAVTGKECGNGVLISHSEGWVTQYCHLEKGSVRVRPGQSVMAGEPIGRVGLSGETAFPHLHFAVRHSGQKIDPFALGGRCGTPSPSLWETGAARSLAYRSSEVLNTGFALGAVDRDGIEYERLAIPDRDSPAIVAWARMIGLGAGDVVSLKLTGPDGTILAQSSQALDRAKAEWISYTGKKRSVDRWPPGVVTAEVTVTSSGRTVLIRHFSMRI